MGWEADMLKDPFGFQVRSGQKAAEGVLDEFGIGPDYHRTRRSAEVDAERVRNEKEAAKQRRLALMERIRAGGYDKAVADRHFEGAKREIDQGMFDASRQSAAGMSRRGLGNSTASSALQTGVAGRAASSREQAMRDAISHAEKQHRQSILDEYMMTEGLEGTIGMDPFIMQQFADQKGLRDGTKNFLLKAGGKALGYAANPIGSAIGDAWGSIGQGGAAWDDMGGYGVLADGPPGAAPIPYPYNGPMPGDPDYDFTQF